MMETKLWAALCALLFMNLASTKHDVGHGAPSPSSKTAAETPATEFVPMSGPGSISLAATTPSPNGSDTGASVTSSLSGDTTTERKTISPTPEPKKDNDTHTVFPSVAARPEHNGTDQSTSQPPSPPSGSHVPTSAIPLTSTTMSSPHTTHTTPADTTPTTNMSHHAALPHNDSITNQPTNPETHSPTSVPTPKPATTHSTTTQSSSTSTSSSQKPTSSDTLTLTPPQVTSGPIGHPETSSETHQKTTIVSPSTPSTQSKAHADTPSQLNVGGDTTMVHESPTLDPLLAGLVSAFIITAVIITLLLFLKLRRRDNRPEFRRLQDLPMDDMMEDTPLSMYSY